MTATDSRLIHLATRQAAGEGDKVQWGGTMYYLDSWSMGSRVAWLRLGPHRRHLLSDKMSKVYEVPFKDCGLQVRHFTR